VLVVSRKRNEAIMIGDGVEVRVLRTGREAVRLGITAPPHIAVYRREIYDQIRAANATAAGSAATPDVVDQLRRRIDKGRPPEPER
jgi:carbon storage regulator